MSRTTNPLGKRWKKREIFSHTGRETRLSSVSVSVFIQFKLIGFPVQFDRFSRDWHVNCVNVCVCLVVPGCVCWCVLLYVWCVRCFCAHLCPSVLVCARVLVCSCVLLVPLRVCSCVYRVHRVRPSSMCVRVCACFFSIPGNVSHHQAGFRRARATTANSLPSAKFSVTPLNSMFQLTHASSIFAKHNYRQSALSPILTTSPKSGALTVANRKPKFSPLTVAPLNQTTYQLPGNWHQKCWIFHLPDRKFSYLPAFKRHPAVSDVSICLQP
jgi:hypothetical protein